MTGRWWPVLMALLMLAATSGCTAEATPETTTPIPFTDCTSLTSPPPSPAGAPSSAGFSSARPSSARPSSARPSSAGPSSAGPSSAGSGSASSVSIALPDLRLPCFAGGQPVSLRDLRGPAVITLWASWCTPCRTELPVMQRLADQADGRLMVLGVNTGDSREGGASFAADRGVSMPTLVDADRKLIDALGRAALPVTVFLDAGGRAVVHPLPLDAWSLADQVRTHTGVAVTL